MPSKYVTSKMMAEYNDILAHHDLRQTKGRAVMQVLRAMSQDHRYSLEARLACMAQMLDDNRDVWSNA